VDAHNESEVLEGLAAVQASQRSYDAAMWDITAPDHANLRHIHIHLSITTAKLARLVEPRDHDDYHGREVESLDKSDVGPIVADLVMHAAQLSNVLGIDLGDAFAARYRQNAKRFAPDSPLASFGEGDERLA
jgi:hypothetical protein